MTRWTLLLFSTAFLLLGQQSNGQTKIDSIDSLYKDCVSKGDTAFAHKRYKIAKYYYIKASGFKPSEGYFKNQLAICEAYLFCIQQIDKADSSFIAKKYQEAISYYQTGMKYHYDDKYCESQIKECEKEIAIIKEKDMAYNEAIAKADKFFLQKKYQEAISEYSTALTNKPGDKYSNNQIEKCKQLIKEK